MSRTVPGKNPGHASALRIKDLTPNRRIALCGEHYPIPATILTGPTLGYHSGSLPLYPGEPQTLVVLIRYDDGYLGSCGLEEIGVIPEASGKWSDNFVVDVRKLHLVNQ